MDLLDWAPSDWEKRVREAHCCAMKPLVKMELRRHLGKKIPMLNFVELNRLAGSGAFGHVYTFAVEANLKPEEFNQLNQLVNNNNAAAKAERAAYAEQCKEPYKADTIALSGNEHTTFGAQMAKACSDGGLKNKSFLGMISRQIGNAQPGRHLDPMLISYPTREDLAATSNGDAGRTLMPFHLVCKYYLQSEPLPVTDANDAHPSAGTSAGGPAAGAAAATVAAAAAAEQMAPYSQKKKKKKPILPWRRAPCEFAPPKHRTRL